MNPYPLLRETPADPASPNPPEMREMREIIAGHRAWAGALAQQGHLAAGEDLTDDGCGCRTATRSPVTAPAPRPTT